MNYDIIALCGRFPAPHEKLRVPRSTKGVGGSAGNTANTLVKLGISTDLHAVLGDDELGALCLGQLRQRGVGLHFTRLVGGSPTGVAVIMSGAHEKRMLTFPGPDREAVTFNDLTEERLRSYAHVHAVGPPTQALSELLKRAVQSACTVSLEWNGRDMASVAPPTSINLMNEDEAHRLTDLRRHHAARALAAAVRGAVVLTAGAEGALWSDSSGRCFWETARPVVPVDRTGAGDAFNAGLVKAFVLGADRAACLRSGLQAARECLLVTGGSA